jgi:hypothetical protein
MRPHAQIPALLVLDRINRETNAGLSLPTGSLSGRSRSAYG